LLVAPSVEEEQMERLCRSLDNAVIDAIDFAREQPESNFPF
jgi:hypothetical protein